MVGSQTEQTWFTLSSLKRHRSWKECVQGMSGACTRPRSRRGRRGSTAPSSRRPSACAAAPPRWSMPARASSSRARARGGLGARRLRHRTPPSSFFAHLVSPGRRDRCGVESWRRESACFGLAFRGRDRRERHRLMASFVCRSRGADDLLIGGVRQGNGDDCRMGNCLSFQGAKQ